MGSFFSRSKVKSVLGWSESRISVGGYCSNVPLKTLGIGLNGDVYEVSKDQINFAIKLIWGDELDFAAVKNFERQVRLCKVSSPFLVKNIETIKKYEQRLICVVMELCDSNLDNFVKRFDPSKGVTLGINRLMKIIIQLLLGLLTLHDNRIIHRNIKPANAFILKDDVAKLGDYLLKEKLDLMWGDDDVSHDEQFLAPEIFEGKYNFPADVWSLGLLFYYLCTAKLPFVGSRWNIVDVILKGEYEEIQSDQYPLEVRAMIDTMLRRSPAERPTVRQLLSYDYVRKWGDELKLMEHFPKVTSPSWSPLSSSS